MHFFGWDWIQGIVIEIDRVSPPLKLSRTDPKYLYWSKCDECDKCLEL